MSGDLTQVQDGAVQGGGGGGSGFMGPPKILLVSIDKTLDGRLPAPLEEALRLKHYPTGRGQCYHYVGCGCGTRHWCGSLVDWVWSWQRDLAVSLPVPLPLTPSSTTSPTFQKLPKSSIQDAVLAGLERLRTWPTPSKTVALPLPMFDAGVRAPVPLRISYLIPHHNVTGGMKMIMKQIEFLHARGHVVQAVYRSGRDSDPVLPPWASDTAVDSTLLLSPQQSVLECFKYSDAIVIGYFTQLLEFKDIITCPGPVLYWDQGHEHVFNDPTAEPYWDTVFHVVMQLPIVLLSVSGIIQQLLLKHFSRIAPIIPNGIDCTAFTVSDAQRTILQQSDGVKKVLIVGHPGLPLKNFPVALQALNHVHTAVPTLEVTWMCQAQPVVGGVTFPIRYVVSPAQADIPGVYSQGYHALLFASKYEAWGMPVMEAMASGIPVVTSACYGVDMFALHEVNALIVPPHDPLAMAEAVTKLLLYPDYGAALALNARTIVEQFTWERSMTLFEDALLAATYCLSTIPGSLHGGEAIPSTPTKQLSLPPSKTPMHTPGQGYASGSPMLLTPMVLPSHAPELDPHDDVSLLATHGHTAVHNGVATHEDDTSK